jgi:hypothetical protein
MIFDYFSLTYRAILKYAATHIVTSAMCVAAYFYLFYFDCSKEFVRFGFCCVIHMCLR